MNGKTTTRSVTGVEAECKRKAGFGLACGVETLLKGPVACFRGL